MSFSGEMKEEIARLIPEKEEEVQKTVNMVDVDLL